MGTLVRVGFMSSMVSMTYGYCLNKSRLYYSIFNIIPHNMHTYFLSNYEFKFLTRSANMILHIKQTMYS